MFPDWIIVPKSETFSYHGKAHMYKEKKKKKGSREGRERKKCFKINYFYEVIFVDYI